MVREIVNIQVIFMDDSGRNLFIYLSYRSVKCVTSHSISTALFVGQLTERVLTRFYPLSRLGTRSGLKICFTALLLMLVRSSHHTRSARYFGRLF